MFLPSLLPVPATTDATTDETTTKGCPPASLVAFPCRPFPPSCHAIHCPCGHSQFCRQSKGLMALLRPSMLRRWHGAGKDLTHRFPHPPYQQQSLLLSAPPPCLLRHACNKCNKHQLSREHSLMSEIKTQQLTLPS